jgi:hypothetical protein
MEVTATMKSKYRFTWIFLALWLTGEAFAQSSFYLKDGDRVVFYGDSITEQRLYTPFTETFVVTRFPDRRIEFTHSGWSGDRVTGGGGSVEIRLNRDLIAYRPTVVTIMLGMNDGRYRAFDQELFSTFSGGYEKMVGMIETAKVGFKTANDLRAGRLRIAIFSGAINGASLGEDWKTLDLKLTEATYRDYLKSGIPYSQRQFMRQARRTVK